MTFADSYTLVIPTYDRPELLSRLLDYLEREKIDFPILVMDSSHDDGRARNASRIARSPLAIRIAGYPPDLHPFLKVRDGLKLITTAYASICADDDVILVPALRECVALLDRKPEVSAAHGLYFNFEESRFFDLSYIMYRGPSLAADDPLDRLRQLFARYEAVFYAVSRTQVLRTVFAHVGEVETTLARELLTAALTAVSGHVVRITEFYYGRNTGASLAYEHWHPFKILAESPEIMFREYRVFRRILLEEMTRLGDVGRGPTGVSMILDLILLRYLGPFLVPNVLDLIIADRLKGMTPGETADRVWKTFVRPRPRLYPRESLTGGGLVARWLPARIAGKVVRRDYVLRTAAARARRRYRVFHEFLFPERRGPAVVNREILLGMLERLDAY